MRRNGIRQILKSSATYQIGKALGWVAQARPVEIAQGILRELAFIAAKQAKFKAIAAISPCDKRPLAIPSG
jgi:hypothetical protein